MIDLFKILLLLFCFNIGSNTAYTQSRSLDELLRQHNSNEIPYITVQELAMPKSNPIVLDSRELEEFNVSHLKGAIYVGFNDFDLQKLSDKIPNKDKTIVVYCSLGIRSEIIGEKLKQAGYSRVYNLYGGIFEWKNKGFPVVDKNGTPTDSIHAYSKHWGKWLHKGKKVY